MLHNPVLLPRERDTVVKTSPILQYSSTTWQKHETLQTTSILITSSLVGCDVCICGFLCIFPFPHRRAGRGILEGPRAPSSQPVEVPPETRPGAPLPCWTTSAACYKSLTTNSINLFGIEYLWMPVVPQSTVFCLGLDAPQKLLWSSSKPCNLQLSWWRECFHTGLVVCWALVGSGLKQNGRPRKRETWQRWWYKYLE